VQQKLVEDIRTVVKELYDVSVDIVLTRPDSQFGDFATNVALQLSKQLGKSPRDVAEEITKNLSSELVESSSVAGPGFINLTLSTESLVDMVYADSAKPLQGKEVVAEYSDPNPFKILHAGHLYTSVVGDAIANLLNNAGANVHRVNFGGDIGLHVARTMWALLQDLNGENPDELSEVKESERSEWMAAGYIKGTAAYEDDESAKAAITELNKRLYTILNENDHDSPLAKIYWTCREWSYSYFDEFYARIGTKFEKYYPESTVAELGLKTVKEHIEKGVFEESDGAIVFKGEPYGLHTRVFINRDGLPTYEAKDVGLIMSKKADYNFDMSVIITGNEQEQYMQVVQKAIEQFAPELTKASRHLTHGIVKLQGGVKMSSRKGNILRAVDVLDSASEANKEATGKDDEGVVLGAVKYAFLKQRMGGDIIYDPKESVSLDGNSGPYLQYSHARACSILRKSGKEQTSKVKEVEKGERPLLSKLGAFNEVVAQATEELMPHYIATYLYELAQEFNRFYENNKVIGDAREETRLGLVALYSDTLKTGLGLLGITAPDQM